MEAVMHTIWGEAEGAGGECARRRGRRHQKQSALSENKCSDRARKCNFPLFQEIMTDQPTYQRRDRPTRRTDLGILKLHLQ